MESENVAFVGGNFFIYCRLTSRLCATLTWKEAERSRLLLFFCNYKSALLLLLLLLLMAFIGRKLRKLQQMRRLVSPRQSTLLFPPEFIGIVGCGNNDCFPNMWYEFFVVGCRHELEFRQSQHENSFFPVLLRMTRRTSFVRRLHHCRWNFSRIWKYWLHEDCIWTAARSADRVLCMDSPPLLMSVCIFCMFTFTFLVMSVAQCVRLPVVHISLEKKYLKDSNCHNFQLPNVKFCTEIIRFTFLCVCTLSL